MKSNEKVRAQIFKIIKNQLKDNNPPEIKSTYDRLIKQGFDDVQTNQMIGQCIAVELYEIMKLRNQYDEARYIKNLKNLPKQPFD